MIGPFLIVTIATATLFVSLSQTGRMANYQSKLPSIILQLMECGVHGPAGRFVVKRAVAALGRESDSVITQSLPTMAHTAWVLDLRCRNAMLQVLVRVSYVCI